MPQRATKRTPRTSDIATRTALLAPGRGATATKTLTVAIKPSVFRHLAMNLTELVPAGSHGAGNGRPLMIAEAILPGATARATAGTERRLAGNPGATDDLVRGPRHPGTRVTANE